MISYSQDTIHYITSACLHSPKSNKGDSCPEGINFRYYNDSLEIYGTIVANCCGVHLAKILKQMDTIFITTMDTGQLCNCVCSFCFNVKLKISSGDTLVNLNDTTYNLKSYINSADELKGGNTRIELYPNPTSNQLTIENKSSSKIRRIGITDISGRQIKSIEDNVRDIDLSRIEKGLYFLKIDLNNDKTVIKKVLKN
jgi:hypothetical protein